MVLIVVIVQQRDTPDKALKILYPQSDSKSAFIVIKQCKSETLTNCKNFARRLNPISFLKFTYI